MVAPARVGVIFTAAVAPRREEAVGMLQSLSGPERWNECEPIRGCSPLGKVGPYFDVLRCESMILGSPQLNTEQNLFADRISCAGHGQSFEFAYNENLLSKLFYEVVLVPLAGLPLDRSVPYSTY